MPHQHLTTFECGPEMGISREAVTTEAAVRFFNLVFTTTYVDVIYRGETADANNIQIVLTLRSPLLLTCTQKF